MWARDSDEEDLLNSNNDPDYEAYMTSNNIEPDLSVPRQSENIATTINDDVGSSLNEISSSTSEHTTKETKKSRPVQENNAGTSSSSSSSNNCSISTTDSSRKDSDDRTICKL